MTFAVMLASSIGIGMVFLYGCVGEIITEKSGHLNLGIPGIMCMGTAGGCFGAALYKSGLAYGADGNAFVLTLCALIFCILFSALGGLIYAFLTVTLRCNQNITGLALTTFGAGFGQYFMDNVVKKDYLASASRTMKNFLPAAWGESAFGKIFLSHGFLIYLAIFVAIIAALVLRRTKIGLNLRAVGENPATADAAGINVNAYKYSAIIIGASIAGIGGLCYIMNYIGGTWENSSTIQAMGWLSIALVIFTLWKPDLSIIGSILFGALYILSNYISVANNVKRLVELLPYVVTVIVLIVTSIIGKKETQPPASLGLNYFREER